MADAIAPLLHTALPAVIALSVVLLGRSSHKRFAWGSAAIFLAAMVASLYSPNVVIVYNGPLWASGYSTWALAICALFSVALVAIWRNFNTPSWGASLAAVLSALIIGSMGYWIS